MPKVYPFPEHVHPATAPLTLTPPLPVRSSLSTVLSKANYNTVDPPLAILAAPRVITARHPHLALETSSSTHNTFLQLHPAYLTACQREVKSFLSAYSVELLIHRALVVFIYFTGDFVWGWWMYVM